METISTKQPRARKEHKCNFCYGIIGVGEVYDSQFNIFDGMPYTWKSHLSCLKIAGELKMFDDYDEGVTEDIFYECICNEYNEISDENDTTIHTFHEKLQIVLNHHKITK